MPQLENGVQVAEEVQGNPSNNANLDAPCPPGLTIGCIGNADPGPANASTRNPNSSSDGSGDEGGF